METKHKDIYKTPSTMVFEVQPGGIICFSEVNAESSINNWENGGTTNEEVYM